MCGIIVIKSEKIDQNIYGKFKKTLKFLKKRGPDETKIFKNKKLLVGFTRLSINDLKSASQPYISSCKNFLIVFNGEIVNYKSLVKLLKRKKINLKYGHEAEVILNLFKLYNKDCLNFLRGFFSFVIINLKTNNIFASVDRFSIKPLYYTKINNSKTTILTSDLTTLIIGKFFKEQINFDKVIEFMTLAREFDNKTFYKGIYKVNSSSYINIGKKIISKKYWHPFNFKTKEQWNNKNFIKKLDENFNEIVKLWKISELKTSLCLSTGYDSNLLNFYLKRNKIKFHKFHVVEDKGILKESNLVKEKINLLTLNKELSKFLNYSKNPFPLAHSSCTSLFQLYKTISKKNFKFTINGEGADEVFGGYLRYKTQLKYLKKNSDFPKSVTQLYKKDIENLNLVLKKKVNLKSIIQNKIKKINLKSKSNENKILEFDQLTWIPTLVQRHDAIGMFYGLEVRPPFLDHKLVEQLNLFSGPDKFTIENNKIILKKLLKEQFSYVDHKTKIPTPTHFKEIIIKIIKLSRFKRDILNSRITEIFSKNKLNKILSNPRTDIKFMWRIFIISKMLKK